MANKLVTPETSSFDVLVIGSGSAGLTAAKVAARFGKTVCLIEAAAETGGDCTWTGCVPSKSLLASAKRMHSARTAAQFGVIVGDSIRVDMKAVKSRVEGVQQRIYEQDDSPETLQKLGVMTVFGTARLLDRRTVTVKPRVEDGGPIPAERTLTATRGIVLATGARPRRPQIDGLDDVQWLTYETVFRAFDEVPSKLTVVGGGPIGCELAQAFSRLGASVTLVACALLGGDEPEAAEALEATFASEGIRRVRGRARSVAPAGVDGRGHRLTVALSGGGSGDAVHVVEGEALLVAAGREARTDGLDLDAVGVRLNAAGGIAVDTKLRTSVRGVYAAGDCTGDQQFTHYAGFQGAIATRNILLPLSAMGVKRDGSVPACTFTSPEVARTGLTEAQAAARYGPGALAVSLQPLAHVDRAVCDGDDAHGFLKVVYLRKSYRIVGATAVSPSAGEAISELATAMAFKAKLPQLALVMRPYPALSFALTAMAERALYAKLDSQLPQLHRLKRWGL